MVTANQIKAGLISLGLEGVAVEVHSSLSSFGYVEGGAEVVVRALLDICVTVLVPTYSSIGRTRPPENDRPKQNSCDYEYVDTILPTKEIASFAPETFGVDSQIDRDMGIIPRTVLQTPGMIRSKHPSVSWAANGRDAVSYVHPHPPDDPMRPLKKLYEAGGYVLMLGVPLSECTALHLAEEMAGRCPFIRWTLYSDGVVRRMREYGCSGGFPNLKPYLERYANRLRIGKCNAIAYPIRELVETGAELMRRSPEITLCPQGKAGNNCRCSDAAKGGPVE
ncbi:AAC(3) family N-acetyltransferase [Candidatus Poribacteria bacterium]|nr:AAC(3) family N-acetyltransferase [Candidatus Poribacteria bacterium]